jgi:hypothetical protein
MSLAKAGQQRERKEPGLTHSDRDPVRHGIAFVVESTSAGSGHGKTATSKNTIMKTSMTTKSIAAHS